MPGFVTGAGWRQCCYWEQVAVLAATADDTIRTSVYDAAFAAPFPEGIADRMLRNGFIATWQGREDEVRHSRRGDPHRRAVRRAEAGQLTGGFARLSTRIAANT